MNARAQSTLSTISSRSKAARAFLYAAPFLLLFLFLPPAPARAEEKAQPDRWSFEEILPEDTLLFVECAGVDRLLADRDSLDIFKIWSEEEVKAFFAEALEKLPGLLAAESPCAFPVKEMWTLFKGPAALAVTSRTTIVGDRPIPAAALALDTSGRKETFTKALNSLLEKASGIAGIVRESGRYRGLAIGRIGFPKRRATLCYTTIRNLFVVSLNRYYLESIIDCHLDKELALAENPAFMRSLHRVGGNAVRFLAFVNIGPLAAAIRPFRPFEFEKAADLLGIAGIDALCLAGALENGQGRDSLFIDCPGPKKGLLKALAPHPVSPESARFAPPDTLLFNDAVIDPGLILKEAKTFVEKVLPEFSETFDGGLARFKEQTGLDLEKDVFATLGDEITLSVSVPSGGMAAIFPDVVLSLAIDDAGRFEALRDKVIGLLEKEKVRVVESDFEGRTLYRVVPPGDKIPLSPTFTVEKGRLFAAGTPLTLKRYLKWLAGGGPTLKDKEDFQAAASRIPKGASVVKYADLGRIVEMAYDTCAPFLGLLLSRKDVPFDAAMLPLSEIFTRNISGASSYAVIDEEGILFSGRWLLGTDALFTAAASAADYLVEKDLIGGVIMKIMKSAARKSHPAPPPEFPRRKRRPSSRKKASGEKIH